MKQRGRKRTPIFKDKETLALNLASVDGNVRRLAFNASVTDYAVYNWMRKFGLHTPVNEKRVPGKLNKTEMKILKLISDGLNDARIGKRLGLAHASVETYRVRMRENLKAKNSSHMIAIAFRTGMLK